MAPPLTIATTSLAVLLLLLSFLLAASVVSSASASASEDSSPSPDQTTTCAPSLQRLLSCLDFIEHRSDAIPTPCCVQVRRTVAEQPCCLMHVVRGDAARLIGPEYDNARAVVDVTEACLGDAAVLVNITRNCSGKPLPPLTPEFPFATTAADVVPPPPPSSSGATMMAGSSSSAWTSLLLGLVATVVYGAVAVLQI